MIHSTGCQLITAEEFYFCVLHDAKLHLVDVGKQLRQRQYLLVFLSTKPTLLQGNGHERDFLDDKRVFIMDMYNRYIYPGDGYAKSE